MNHAIEFIEPPIFTKQIKVLATDDELKNLQVELIAQPEKGDLIWWTEKNQDGYWWARKEQQFSL